MKETKFVATGIGCGWEIVGYIVMFWALFHVTEIFQFLDRVVK